MDIYDGVSRAGFGAERTGAANLFLEFCGATMGFTQREMFVDFQVQLDEEMRLEFMRGKLMNGEAESMRRGTDGIEEVFACMGARFHVNHDIGVNDLADAAFDGVTDGMDLLETGRARHADRDVDKMTIARAAHANTLGAEYAIDLLDGLRDAFLQTDRSYVEKCIDGAASELRGDPYHHARYDQSSQGIGIMQPR